MKFEAKNELSSHVKSHLKIDNKYKCDICDFTHDKFFRVTAHKLIHTTERNFSCVLCEKRFKTKWQLEAH